MNQFYLGLILISIAGLFCLGAVYLVFRKSIVATIGGPFMIIVTFIADFGYVVGSKGLIQLAWTVPVSLIVLFTVFYFTKRRVGAPLKKLTRLINLLSEGDLGVNFDHAITGRSDEVGEISTSINGLNKNLKEFVGHIQSITEELSGTSQELNSSANQMSEASNQQASSSEEISTSIEEISANISQTSANASKTLEIASNSAFVIKDGSEASTEALKSMTTISEKTKIINDIAFQTNILALNAAVEAARAGEYGKGFAVVAAEVRKLAERSKIAADEIAEYTEHGMRTTEKSEQKLRDILPKMQETVQLINEVASASQEQDQGTKQISQGVMELSQISQINAESSDVLTKSSYNLSDLSSKLLETISFFKIEEEYKTQLYQNQRIKSPKLSNKAPKIVADSLTEVF